MRKFLAISAVLAMLLAAAGCGGTEKTPEETTDTSKTGGVVTKQILGTEPEEDTTDEAIAYIREKAPLFAAFIDKRRQIPLAFETSVTTEEGTFKTAIYIKDEHTLANSAIDQDGNENRTVYMDGKAYNIVDTEKTVYYMDYANEQIAKLVETYQLKIPLSEAESTIYVCDEQELDGVMYDHVSLQSASSDPANYYFDKETGDLRFIESSGQLSEILALNGSVPDSVFEIPADYEQVDYQQYLLDQREKNEAAAAAQ